MAVFHHLDYRPAIKECVDLKKATNPAFTYSFFAENLGVQKTFISKVFNEDAHLNDDHMYLVEQTLQLSKQEMDYLRLLYAHSKSGLETRRQDLLAQIHRLQEDFRRSNSHLTATFIKPDSNSIEYGSYYLDPLHIIVHTYLNLERYRKDPQALLTRLQITPQQLNKSLSLLQQLDFIQKKGPGFLLKQEHHHLDSQSPLCTPHQLLLRVKSTEQLMKLNPSQRFMFSVTYSANADIQKQIQDLFLQYAKEIQAIVQTAPSEDVYQLNFELFPWSANKG